MTCFETLELHPQSPADLARLARAEAHARGCDACAARLAELRLADELLARGLGLWIEGSACPEVETLAAWIDAGRPRDEALECHLSGCAECRADLLGCLADEQAAPARLAPARSARSRRGARRAAALLGAAALLLGLGLPLYLSGPGGTRDLGSKHLGALPSEPAPLPSEPPTPRRAELPQPRRVQPGREDPLQPARLRPSAEPRPGSSQPLAPAPSPASQPEVRPPSPARLSPSPALPAPAEPEASPLPPTNTPDPAPSPATSPEAGEPKPSPTGPAPPPAPQPPAGPVVAAALSVVESEGLFVRLPEGRGFQAFTEGELPAGSELRAGPRGARVRLGQGQVFVQGQGRLRWGEGLEVERGQVLLEGRALRVRTAGGEVEVTGRALVEARREQVGVRVLFGRARYQQGEQDQTLEPGQVLTGARGKAPRVSGGGSRSGPSWVRPLRPLPRGRRPLRRGGANPGATPRRDPSGQRR